MKKLIINCDDLAISKETNLGIIDCLLNKKASSASIIANGDFFYNAVEEIKNKIPNQYFGIHLNLTEGKALNNNSLKTLTNSEFKFKTKSSSFFLMNFYKNEIINKAIYLELKTQILKVLDSGIKISHFDSHEHIHHSPFIFEILLKLGEEFKINKIRLVNERLMFSNYFRNFKFKFLSKNYIKLPLLNFCTKRIKNNFFISTNYFYGILNSGKIDQNAFFSYINKMNDNSTIELCVHPANQILNDNIKNEHVNDNFTFSTNRYLEKKLLFSDEFSEKLLKNNIKLINFTDLN